MNVCVKNIWSNSTMLYFYLQTCKNSMRTIKRLDEFVSVRVTPVIKGGATVPDFRLRWEPSDETSGAAQRVLSQVDSWLSTSPVVCVLAEQCLYPRRQHTASGPDTKTQALEFLQTPLILMCSLSLFPQTNSRDKGRGVKIAQHRADFIGVISAWSFNEALTCFTQRKSSLSLVSY